MISRGTGTIQRKNARNYSHKSADARLKEAVAPYQQQGLNALKVDSFEVYYYPVAQGTTICTCKQTEIIPEYSRLEEPPTLVKQDQSRNPIMIDYTRTLFGSANENGSNKNSDSDGDFDELEIDDDQDTENPVMDSTFATKANCGICYRTGFVPGYNRYGRERVVLATQHITDAYGYHVDVTEAPHRCNKLDTRTGYIEYELNVPKYFRQAFYSVRNNTDILHDALHTTDDVQLTLADLKNAAGKTLLVRVHAPALTHVVVEFDLGTDPVLANMAQYSKSLDWTLFDTLGNISLNLPMTIPTVSSSDLVYVPQRNLTLKITDVTYLRTSKDANLDWSVSTRVLQPMEAAKHIAKQNPVL